MGNIHVVYQTIKPVFDRLSSIGIFGEPRNFTNGRIFEWAPVPLWNLEPEFYDEVRRKPVVLPETRPYDPPILGCFISDEYRVPIGDFRFEKFSNPENTDKSFGPAIVIGFNSNTGDRWALDERLKVMFGYLEEKGVDVRRKSLYRGVFYVDHGLFNYGEILGKLTTPLQK